MIFQSNDWILPVTNKLQLKIINTLLKDKGYSTEYTEEKDFSGYDAVLGNKRSSFCVTLCSMEYNSKGREKITLEDFIGMLILDNAFSEAIGDFTATYKKGDEFVVFGNNIRIPIDNILELDKVLTENRNIPYDWYLRVSDEHPDYTDFISLFLEKEGIYNKYVGSQHRGYDAVIYSSNQNFCMTNGVEEKTEITPLQFMEMVKEKKYANSIRLNNDYECLFFDDTIKIGCQRINRNVAKEFIDKLKQYIIIK